MLTFSCIHKPTCYMIGFISPSANNQQSVNMNWRQTITNSTHSLQSANRDPYDTHSPQSPFGPVFEGRTHSEDLSSKRWASYDSSSPSVRPTAQRFDHIWRDCRVYLCENLWRDVCSPSFFFFHFIFQQEILLQPLWHRHLLELFHVASSDWGKQLVPWVLTSTWAFSIQLPLRHRSQRVPQAIHIQHGRGRRWRSTPRRRWRWWWSRTSSSSFGSQFRRRHGWGYGRNFGGDFGWAS